MQVLKRTGNPTIIIATNTYAPLVTAGTRKKGSTEEKHTNILLIPVIPPLLVLMV